MASSPGPATSSIASLMTLEAPELDVAAFSRMLDGTTTSYKYLFLLALVEKMARTPLDRDVVIPLRDMVLEMAALAWYPSRYFRLNFGAADRMPRLLEHVSSEISSRNHALQVLGHVRDLICQHPAFREQGDSLLRFVPYRLLRPFFVKQTAGLQDHRVDRTIRDLALSSFATDHPSLYAIQGEGTSPESLALHLHPEWRTLIARWQKPVKAWILYGWAQYLQARNPAMPNVLGKILPPDQRNAHALRKIASAWKQVMARNKVSCPYSGHHLTPDDFALDHFLPWSFVGHDQPWNLVPTHPGVNSAKGARLPHHRYIGDLAQRQQLALASLHSSMTSQKWSQWTESYCQDLRLDVDDLANAARLQRAFEMSLKPQISLGVQLGFEGGWVYRAA